MASPPWRKREHAKRTGKEANKPTKRQPRLRLSATRADPRTPPLRGQPASPDPCGGPRSAVTWTPPGTPPLSAAGTRIPKPTRTHASVRPPASVVFAAQPVGTAHPAHHLRSFSSLSTDSALPSRPVPVLATLTPSDEIRPDHRRSSSSSPTSSRREHSAKAGHAPSPSRGPSEEQNYTAWVISLVEQLPSVPA